MVEADVVATWGARSPAYKLHVLTANVSPANATDDKWLTIDVPLAGQSKITGDGSNRGRPRLRMLELPKTMKVRALRFEYFDGIRRGKDGPRWRKAQPQRINCDRVELLRLRDEILKEDKRGVPAWYTVIDIASGKTERRELTYGGDVKSLAAGNKDEFWALHQGKIVRTRLVKDEWKHTVVAHDSKGRDVKKLIRCGDDIAILHHGPIVFIDANSGKQNNVIGGWDGYQRGPWDRNTLERPASVSQDASDYWLVESSWYPKRVARFNRKGICEWNVNGQPEYGGGGWIAPDFKHLHYRGMRFDINYEAGTSHMVGLYDRPYTEETPDPERSFGFSTKGRIIEYQGYEYVVGDGSYIGIIENHDAAGDGVWLGQ